MTRTNDRFGLTWHPSIAGGVLAHLDRIDLIEVIPEGRFLESRRARRALRRLARTLPVSIHGVSLGLATVAPIDRPRLDLLARLVGDVEPESWSEHLAFVRAGGIELGHLAAPPRTALSVEAVAEHVEQARRAIGTYPSLENVATPIDPPGSDRAEMTWLLDVLSATPAGLLLDLHNLYANGTNFGVDPAEMLRACPVDRVRTIHIAGGVNVHASGEVRVMDDHLHDVPDPVYELLEIVGERAPYPVDVVLERDGAFPPIEDLLAQLDRARAALARGRVRLGGPNSHPDVCGAWSGLVADGASGEGPLLLCGPGRRNSASAHREEDLTSFGSSVCSRAFTRTIERWRGSSPRR
jgi:uncharacterized protein